MRKLVYNNIEFGLEILGGIIRGHFLYLKSKFKMRDYF